MQGGALCRVCGAPGAERDLHAAALRPLHKRIQTLFDFHVKPTDASTSVCHQCVKFINQFYTFHRKVLLAQKKLSSEICEKDIKPDKQEIIIETRSFSEDTLECMTAFESIANIEEKIDTIKPCDMQDFDSINKEHLLNICETDINNKNELGLILSGESFPTTPEDDNKSNVKPEVKSGDIIVIPNMDTVFNFHYHSDNDGLLHYECEGFHSGDTNEKAVEGKESDAAVEENCDAKKNETEDMSFDKDDDHELSDDASINDVEIPFDFPTEIVRDGKLIYKGSYLDDLISRFYSIQCDICCDYPKFKNRSQMMKHYKTDHKVKGYLKCCNVKFYQHRSVYMHMARHLQPSAFQCPICKKVVSRPHSLKLHIQTHLPEAEKPHSCDQCDRRFSYLDGLNSHKMTHIPVEKREHHKCPVCNKIFTLTSSFSTHMRAAHTSAKYLCSECGRSFQRKTELTYHMLTHDSTGKNKVQCQECGFVCKNEPTLKIHIKRHSVNRIHCTLCDYTTHRRQQLNLHMRVRHTDAKPHECVICGKQFKLKSVLRTHMAQHTGEHRFTCKYCPKTFASPGNYHAHLKRVHPEEHQNSVMLKQKERFKEVRPIKKKKMDIGQSHEIARQFLQKIAKNNKKTI